MELNELKEAFFSSVLEEIHSEDPETLSLDQIEDKLDLAKSQLKIYEEISGHYSVDIYKLKQEISNLSQHITLVTSELDNFKVDTKGPTTIYSEMLKQRDIMEKNLVNIRSSHCKCKEDIENLQIDFEAKKKIGDDKEKELKLLLEDLKAISEPGAKGLKHSETPKKKDIPKREIKSFPATSYSFNFGIVNNPSKDRIVLNRSFNNGEKSSRSSNVSNNNSVIIES